MTTKRHLPVFMLMLAVGLLTACHNDQQEVKKVAFGYLNATGNYRIDEAAPYASKDTRKRTLPFIKNKLIPITDTNYLKANVPATITIDSIWFEGDSAWVAYTKTTPIKRLQNCVSVIREDGKWLVNVPLVLPEAITVGDTSALSITPTNETYTAPAAPGLLNKNQ